MSLSHMVTNALEALKNGNIEEAEKTLTEAKEYFDRNSLLVMNDHQFFHPKSISRVEVIDYNRDEDCRAFVTHKAQGLELQLQDDGRTAKIFLPRAKKHWTEEAKEREHHDITY